MGEPLKRISVGCLVVLMKKNTTSNSIMPGHNLAVWKAVLVGWLVVNIPVIIIMAGVLLIGMGIDANVWWLSLSIGFFLGWAWWSYMIPRWRRWAIQRGAPAEKLQRWAFLTGLVWRKGSVFEKTEFPNDE